MENTRTDEQSKTSPSATALQQTARILEGVSDACVVLDRDWNYVYVNARAGRLFNRLPEQLVGKNIWEEFPEGVDQDFYRAYYRSAETQQFAHVTLAVSDTGTGMTPETRARAFEPFFTTKPAGKGTGLGLSIVYGIVRQLGGTIDLETTTGGGTTFTIALPASEPAATLAPVASTAGTGETVLLVDDQDAIRRTLGSLLKAMGYRVVEARDGASALQLLDSPDTGTIDVLLTDVRMPVMNGVELARRARSAHPELGVVLMSGYGDGPSPDLASARTASIMKPFSSTEISRVLRTVLNGEARVSDRSQRSGSLDAR